MFQVVEKHQRAVKVVIGILALTFVGFGTSMIAIPNDNFVVKVGDEEITEQDVTRVAEGLEGPATDEVKKSILGTLINQSYLLQGAADLNMTVSPEQIKKTIMQEPSFQTNGKFSEELYNNYLQRASLTEDMFVQNIKREFLLRSMLNLVNNGQLVSDVQAKQLIGLMQSERDVRTLTFNTAALASEVKVTDADMQKYYDSHKAEYMQPQAVKFEFVVLAAKRLAEKQTVSDAELQAAYDVAKAGFKPERKIAHILINAPQGADAAAVQAAQKKAADVLAKVKAKPESFAALAKEYSQDAGSATKGGDLGYVQADGNLGPALEAAVFKLKNNEISAVVKSDFGFHIVKVLDIKSAPSFESMKPQLTAQVKEQKALKAMREDKETMTDLAFNNPNSLKELASKLGITVEQSGEWITEAQAKEQQMPEALLKAIFSADAIKAKHNSEPITVADNSIWVVRPTEVRAAKQLSFAEAKNAVEQSVFVAKVNELALKKAQDALAKLQKGEAVDLAWSPKQVVTTEIAKQNLPPQAYEKLLTAKPVNGKPAYVLLEGLPAPVLMEVSNIRLPQGVDAMMPQAKQVLAVQQGEAMLSAYLKELSSKIKIKQGIQTVGNNPDTVQ